MSTFLLIWYVVVIIAGFMRWIDFGLFTANLIALMVLALIFLG